MDLIEHGIHAYPYLPTIPVFPGKSLKTAVLIAIPESTPNPPDLRENENAPSAGTERSDHRASVTPQLPSKSEKSCAVQ